MNKKPNLIVLFCPPVKDYPVQPSDVSLCTKEPCPTCNNLMWLSEKKKLIIEAVTERKDEIHLECFDCFFKTIQSDPEKFVNCIRTDI